MLNYTISAKAVQGGKAEASSNKSNIAFDSTSGPNKIWPNPFSRCLHRKGGQLEIDDKQKI